MRVQNHFDVIIHYLMTDVSFEMKSDTSPENERKARLEDESNASPEDERDLDLTVRSCSNNERLLSGLLTASFNDFIVKEWAEANTEISLWWRSFALKQVKSKDISYISKLKTYCFFCDTKRTRSVVNELSGLEIFVKVFEPIVTNNITNSGKNVKETRRLLPGYVFAYSEDIISISDWDKILKTDGIIKPLGKENAREELEMDEQGNDKSIDYALKDKNDSDFAKLLYGLGGRLDTVHLKDDGRRCVLVDNVWLGEIEATIVKVDRRKSRVKIMFTFAGRCFTTWVAAEIEEEEREEGR